MDEVGPGSQNPGNSQKEKAAAFEQEKKAMREQWTKKYQGQPPKVRIFLLI